MSLKLNTPCFFYPTSVVVVDDSERYLTKLSLELDARLAYVLFSQPQKALEYVNSCSSKNHKSDFFMEDLESDQYGLDSSKLQTKVDFKKIFDIIYDPGRFNTPSVLVVDYSMPELDGYQLCDKLRNSPIKKIMLTGEADDALAVSLFNQGVINKFVSKKQSNCGAIINDLILELQEEYFSEKTQSLIDNLQSQAKFHFKDDVVRSTFEKICKDNNIVEYYMISPTGGYLLLSHEGDPFIFFILDEEELHDYREVAEDHKASSSVIKSFKEGKKIPFFPSHKDFINAEGKEWEVYLYQATKIKGDKVYYYALLKDKEVMDLQQGRVKSYKHYLEHEWPPK